MPDVLTVFVQTQVPEGKNFHGRIIEGCYVVEGNMVTLTNRHGNPVRDADGKPYTQKLLSGENPKPVAGVLTRRFAKARRGNDAPPKGFGAPIDYPKNYGGNVV